MNEKLNKFNLNADNIYYGSLDKNNIPNGKGICYFSDGDIYVGEFKNDLMEGKLLYQ